MKGLYKETHETKGHSNIKKSIQILFFHTSEIRKPFLSCRTSMSREEEEEGDEDQKTQDVSFRERRQGRKKELAGYRIVFFLPLPPMSKLIARAKLDSPRTIQTTPRASS